MNKIEEYLREVVKQVKKLQESIDRVEAKLETLASKQEALLRPSEIAKVESQTVVKPQKTKE